MYGLFAARLLAEPRDPNAWTLEVRIESSGYETQKVGHNIDRSVRCKMRSRSFAVHTLLRIWQTSRIRSRRYSGN